MSNVVQFTPRNPEMQAERAERIYQRDMAALRGMPISTLRKLWDEVGDSSFYEGPHGFFDCAYIHAVLNEKGDGAYCAV